MRGTGSSGPSVRLGAAFAIAGSILSMALLARRQRERIDPAMERLQYHGISAKDWRNKRCWRSSAPIARNRDGFDFTEMSRSALGYNWRNI